MDDEPRINLRIKQPYECEYARSPKSSCRGCGDKINENELRLARMVEVQTYDGDGPEWYHFDCFFEDNDLKSTGDLGHFTSLRFKDQKRIEAKIDETSEGNGASGPKKRKMDPELEEYLQEQSDLLYKYIDQLEGVKTKDVNKLLVHNGYEVHRKTDKVRKLELLADALAFGALQKCPECQNGQLSFSIAGYICSGLISDLVKCVYETTRPNRKPFEVPDELKESHKFLAEYKYVLQVRVMNRVQRPVDAVDMTEKRNVSENGSGNGCESQSAVLLERQTLVIKDGTAVDPQSGLQDVAVVYKEGDRIYSEVLNQVDLHANKNSYYKIQLLKDENRKDKYWVFTSWGRVGTERGKFNNESFRDLEYAIEKFEQVFFEKTQNNYCNRLNMVRKVGSYYPLKINYIVDGDAGVKMEMGKSKLHEAVQKLVMMLFDLKLLYKEMKVFELDMATMPLGKLSKDQILSAYKVLSEISKLIRDDSERGKLVSQNEAFYTLIPHTFERTSSPLICTNDEVEKKREMLDSLLQMESAFEMISCVQGEETTDDLINQHYLKLKTEISILNTQDSEYKLINEYLTSTYVKINGVKILEAFKVCRHGEEERYKTSIGLNNKMLLWHGSRITNFAGILSKGFELPPEGFGLLFGKGVYFADMSCKSADYCHAEFSDGIGLLALCEVALGEMLELTKGDKNLILPPGKHSVKGCGKFGPNPKKSKKIDGDVVVPCGRGEPTKTPGAKLNNNEFVVYDISQIKMRYLVMVEFNYTLS